MTARSDRLGIATATFPDTLPPADDDWSARQRRYFDRNLDEYEHERALKTRAYRRKAQVLADALRAHGSREVLEMGAGSGLVSTHLMPALPWLRYVALDLSVGMLAAARTRTAHTGSSFVVADASSVGLANGRFDAVVGVDILHHLASPSDAMREWRRVTRRGGLLAVLETNPYPVNLQFIGVEHESRLFLNSRANLLRWATDAGWEDVSLVATSTFTPSGPRWLGPLLDTVDRLMLNLPACKWLSALWLLTGRKRSD